MSTIKALFEAAKTIVKLGAATNAACRQDIRDVVGQLADELDRALGLADAYLVGIRFSKDDAEMASYLQSVSSKLMNNFYENHVCAGLYSLADKFEQVFNPTRFSVSIGSKSEIKDLIQHLKDGERAVIDDLNEMVAQLQDYAMQLHAAKPDEIATLKDRIAQATAYHRDQIKKRRTSVRNIRRRTLDAL